jgi:hypothetical protein
LAKALDAATDRLVLAARASGGTAIWTTPDSTFSVPPVLEITPPSSTVTVDVPLFPSTVAVIVAVPGATPATIPEVETVAFAGSDVVQTKVRCSCSPEAALAVAKSCTVAAGTRVAVSDEIVTVAVVGGGGPTMLSPPPPQEPISQPRVIDPIER